DVADSSHDARLSSTASPSPGNGATTVPGAGADRSDRDAERRSVGRTAIVPADDRRSAHVRRRHRRARSRADAVRARRRSRCRPARARPRRPGVPIMVAMRLSTCRWGARVRRRWCTRVRWPLGAFTLLLALAPGAARAGAPAPGELRVGVARVPASLDPAAATTADELMALRLVYQGLLTFGERGDLEPALATGWSVSRDGLVWSFRVRPDVPLHDGTVLGTDDVVAALAERVSAEEPA